MAPSPDTDNTPKAPDKNEEDKTEKQNSTENDQDKGKDGKPDTSVTPKDPDKSEDKTEEQNPTDIDEQKVIKELEDYNEGELKNLLDEALDYRGNTEGKSLIFTKLLKKTQKEDADTTYNKTGSLERLNVMESTKRNVSSRRGEGGSMPSNVNAINCTFMEAIHLKPQEVNIEEQSLLEHDVLAQGCDNTEKRAAGEESDDIQGLALSYTSKATFPVNTSNVDNSISLELERKSDKKNFDADNIQAKVVHTPNNIYTTKESSVSISVKQGNACAAIEDNTKKVDENDNALQQTTSMKGKKKKANTDKNVKIFDATSVEGHRSDIINEVDLLVNFIEGDDTKKKPKQLHKQHTEDGGSHGSGKRRSQSSKSKECKSDLKKSNSLGEISSVKTEDFTLSVGGGPDDKVVLRLNKSGANERSRDRRSLGDMEAPPIQKQFNNASMEKMENLETADFRVVTKRKNKNKKRRNSISTGRRQTTSTETASKHTQNRAPSPDICTRKYADSVPHSEKSNDSSDADSVYSLSIDTPHLNIPTSPMTETATSAVPVSYADIARNSDKPKDKKSETSLDKVPKEKTPTKTEIETATTKVKTKTKPPTVVPGLPVVSPGSTVVEKTSPVVTSGAVSPAGSVKNESKTNAPPDVHNIKNFPAIQPTNNKLHNIVNQQAAAVPVEKTNNNVKVCSNKVQKSASVNNNNNNRSKNSVQKISSGAIVQNMMQKDIQTDLSIIQANEKESIQYNAQMLPPDIPDVQTIEKMQFMGRHMQQNYQKQHKQQQNMVSQHNLQHQQLQQPQQVQQQPQHASPSPSPLMNSHIIVQQQQQSSPVMQHQHVQHQQQQNISNVVDCDNSSDRTSASSLSTTERERPPVVILSGAGNKEVPGLVFGFDVNEKLLNEDMCEDIMSRFVPPPSFTNTSHNHDKIVNFVGSAWEDIANSGNVTYYSDDL